MEEKIYKVRFKNDEYLSHYASPYYDPIKAHEYYEEHKKLKGHNSTKGFSEEAKNTYAYVKKAIADERKSKVEKHRSLTKSQIKQLRENAKIERTEDTKSTKARIEANAEEARSKIASHSEKMASRIKKLQEQYSNMSYRSKNSTALADEIDKLRSQNEKQREFLVSELEKRNLKLRSDLQERQAARSEKSKSEINRLSSSNKSYAEKAKKDAEEKLNQEYENIKSSYSNSKKKKTYKSSKAEAPSKPEVKGLKAENHRRYESNAR